MEETGCERAWQIGMCRGHDWIPIVFVGESLQIHLSEKEDSICLEFLFKLGAKKEKKQTT